jgi:hypothetical protein
MERLLKNRTLEECFRDSRWEIKLRPYIPFAKTLVTLRRLMLQYWRSGFDRLPLKEMFLVMFTIFMTWLFAEYGGGG